MSRLLEDFKPLQGQLENAGFRGSNQRGIEYHEYDDSEKIVAACNFQKRKNSANLMQSQIIGEIISTYSSQRTETNKCFLLMAAGGTGKTFVQNTIIEYIKSKEVSNYSFVTMSSTAISAQLLENGRTAHSTMKLPLDIFEPDVRCGIDFSSSIATQLRQAKVIFWDEIFGMRKELVDAVDKFFQNLHSSTVPFGGILTIFSGDLRQTLPKLKHARRGTIANACFTRSNCFKYFKIRKLTQNMRLQDSETNRLFAKYLLDVGDRKLSGYITVPSYIKLTKTLDELITFVFGSNINDLSTTDLAERAILAPLNKDVADINDKILHRLRGNEVVYLSTDEELDPNGNLSYDIPSEVLNSTSRPGLPPHKLILKPGCLVMCMRNLSREVCNGTKLQVQSCKQYLLDCKILTGPGKGKIITIPRIKLTDNNTPNTFILRRKQFPVCLAYAITIDKSQGQSLEHVGVSLTSECFAHGQLYTAIS